MKSHSFVTVVGATLALVVSSPASVLAAELDTVSVKLFQMQKASAESQKNPQAQYYLAQMYEHGLGTQEDLTAAREWYRRAADQGLKVAKLQLMEIDKTAHEDAVDRQRSAERAKAIEQAKATASSSKEQNEKVAALINEEKLEADRRAARDRARAERKRRAMEVLRKAKAAAGSGDPFE